MNRILHTDARRGSALLPSLLLVTTLAALAATIFSLGLAHSNEVGSIGRETRALYVAEAGLADALLQVATARRNDEPIPVELGTAEDPIEISGGAHWCTIVDNGDDTYTVHATGSAGRARRTIEGILERTGGSIFDHAVFAGNLSGDPAYTLRFGGTGAQADAVNGDVYSAGDVLIEGNATVAGDVLATGSVVGAAGIEGVTRPVPDIEGMDYANTSDVLVKSEFDAGESWQASDLGGSAFQVPETSPAHIFRKNPDDRGAEISGTVKDDYFLEDPYMPLRGFNAAYSGEDGHEITLSTSGNELVYFVDGNLWVHNRYVLVHRLATQASGTRVTFVARGNVYFSDAVVLDDEASDGLAFIAITDPAEADSGNVYFGDPRYGTLDRMQAYIYAERDFYDLNLDETGSKVVELMGTMTAGNHVLIQRDFVAADGAVAHSKLDVRFDPRLSQKAIELPGIPRVHEGVAGYRVAFWREIGEE